MGPLILSAIWGLTGFLLRTRWAMALPVLVGAAVLMSVEIGGLDQSEGLGRLLVYLGGDYEFWWLAYVLYIPWYLLLIELGYRLRRRLEIRQSTKETTEAEVDSM